MTSIYAFIMVIYSVVNRSQTFGRFSPFRGAVAVSAPLSE